MDIEPHQILKQAPVVEPAHVREATAVGARQGVISGRVVTVLIVSLTLAVLAMFIGYMVVR